jgi:hypothetical protein
MSSRQICGKLTQWSHGKGSVWGWRCIFPSPNRGRGITRVNSTCVPVSITHTLTCWHTGLLPGPHAASDPLTSLSLSRLSLSRHLRAAGLCPGSVNTSILFHSIWNSVDSLVTLCGWTKRYPVITLDLAILHVWIVLMFISLHLEPNQQYRHCTMLAGLQYFPLYFGNPLTTSLKDTLPAPGSWQQVPAVAALLCCCISINKCILWLKEDTKSVRLTSKCFSDVVLLSEQSSSSSRLNVWYVYPNLVSKIQTMQAEVTNCSHYYSYLFESKLSPKRMLSLRVALSIQGSWLTYAQEPSLVTWPEDRCSCPRAARSNAVLPDPTWPQTPISSPYTIHTQMEPHNTKNAGKQTSASSVRTTHQ